MSRKGNSLTNQFPDVVEPLRALRSAVGRDFLLDGEIVSTTSDGFAGFQVLQARLAVEKPFQIRMLALRIPAAFVGFDLHSVGGRALLDRPLAERGQVLEALLSARRPASASPSRTMTGRPCWRGRSRSGGRASWPSGPTPDISPDSGPLPG
jgi:ATP-dependent DNA ligase